MLELAPGGFEERELDGSLELAAYGDAAVEEALRSAFDDVRVEAVEEGWADRWRAFHHGRQVGGLWVGPSWEQPPPGVITVVVDPGRAFGTGAHPTTRLCLELLQALPRSSVVDVGSGSGVLAVAAAALGFRPVWALDHDPAAIEATRANAEANGVVVETLLGDARETTLPAAEIALANVTLEVVERLHLPAETRQLLASGYLAHERVTLAGFTARHRVEREGWAAELLERSG
jgi:ribosomal protein L11 methyltransferase